MNTVYGETYIVKATGEKVTGIGQGWPCAAEDEILAIDSYSNDRGFTTRTYKESELIKVEE